MGSIPGSGRSLGRGNGNPLQYFCLGNAMDRGAWWATVHGVTKKSETAQQLNNNRLEITCNTIVTNTFILKYIFFRNCLGNAMDRGAWRATVHGVTKKSETTQQLNNNKLEITCNIIVTNYLLQEFSSPSLNITVSSVSLLDALVFSFSPHPLSNLIHSQEAHYSNISVVSRVFCLFAFQGVPGGFQESQFPDQGSNLGTWQWSAES